MSHFYNKNGQNVFEIVGANGRKRKPNIRDARKHGYIPSVTTILGILSAPELERWKIGQVMEATRNNPKGSYQDIMDVAFKKSNTALDFGNSLHKWLESLLKKTFDFDTALIPQKTKNALTDHFMEHLSDVLASEKAIVMPKYAGTPDLVCLLKDGRRCVYDFKNQGSKDGKFKYYEKYLLQASAYAKATQSDCFRILNVSRDEPGIIEFKEFSGKDMDDCYNMFDACCTMYYLRNKLEALQ